MQAISRVAGHTLLHDRAERCEGGPDIVARAGVLRFDGKAAGRPVHLRPDILHALRHERCDVRGTMKFQRTHAQTLLGDGRCLVKSILGKGNIDFLQRQ